MQRISPMYWFHSVDYISQVLQVEKKTKLFPNSSWELGRKIFEKYHQDPGC